MSIPNKNKTGVVLMTYGSPTTAKHVPEYMERIYKGKASAALIADFENRYRIVGHSPLVEITKKQASLLEKTLGKHYVVRAGMRHSKPHIKEAVAQCIASRATSLVGLILSPQFSSLIMRGYQTDFAEAARAVGVRISMTPPWPAQEHYIALLTARIKNMLAKIRHESGADAVVIFTTHSLPQHVVEKDPDYLQQLKTTIDAIRKKLDVPLWYAAYQSAGHTPEAWMKPDLTDIFTALRAKKTSALIVPIQFLADHLEILYDLDVAARKQCEEHGIAYYRIEMPNTDPLFIKSLSAVVKEASLHQGLKI